MNEIITISIPNFEKWQTRTAKRRSWIAISRGLFDDPRVEEAMALCPDALPCYLWCLLHADECGQLCIKLSSLKRGWMRATAAKSNFFKHEPRLFALENSGLLEVYRGSNDDLQRSYPESTEVLPEVYRESTDNLPPSKWTVELSQTQSGCEKNKPYKQTDKQNKHTHKDVRECVGENNEGNGETGGGCEPIFKIAVGLCHDYVAASGNPNLINTGWVKGFLSVQFQLLSETRPELAEADIIRMWQETVDSASAKGVSAPKWFQTAFEGKVKALKSQPEIKVIDLDAQAKALLAYPQVRDITTGDIINTSQVIHHAPGVFLYLGQVFDPNWYEALEEIPDAKQ